MPILEPIETVAGEGAAAEFIHCVSPAALALAAMAEDVAPTDIPVLILGESGTGKDAYARLLHRLSGPARASLQKINCSAVGCEDLLSRLLPALGGNFAADSVPTIYLDNLQDLSADGQRVLLSQLPDQETGQSAHRFSARLISSSTRNLDHDVSAGRFRRELYFRLNGVCLRLPALRERADDLPDLLEHFIKKHSLLLHKKSIVLSAKATQTLGAYHWPGNIRELENVARKMVVFGDVQMALNDLQAGRMVIHGPGEAARGASLKVAARAASKQAERELIIQALERTRWNRKRAAHDLQISYKSLLHKIKQIGPINGEPQG